MLVLSRKLYETIVITHPDGGRATIGIVGVRGDTVRISVAAPTEWGINRSEVQARLDSGTKTE